MTPDDDTPPRSDAQQVCWVAIFGANLVVPLGLVWPQSDQGGQEGLLAGLAVLFALWQFVIPRVEPLRAVLVPGGVAVAASQVFPALQLVVGMVSLTLVMQDDYFRPGKLDQETGFFLAVVYGVLMLLAAAGAGLVLRGIGRRLRRAKPAVAAGER